MESTAPTTNPDENSVTNEATEYLAVAADHLARIFADANVCPSHGIAHARDVTRLTRLALKSHAVTGLQPRLTSDQVLMCLLAALLHDADDRKFFPDNDGYQNARAVLAHIRSGGACAETVIRMISWVSTSANGSAVPQEAAENPWMLYPRHADRIAASGWTGVERCWKYNTRAERPLYTKDTPRALDEKDLWARIATPERFAAYRGDSASMLDHYYDKLLHVTQFATENEFLATEARRRMLPLLEVVLAFGQMGDLPEDLYARAAVESEKEMTV